MPGSAINLALIDEKKREGNKDTGLTTQGKKAARLGKAVTRKISPAVKSIGTATRDFKGEAANARFKTVLVKIASVTYVVILPRWYEIRADPVSLLKTGAVSEA